LPDFFDRYVELQVGSTLITLDDLDIEFVVENDDESKAGQAEITVYNLGKSKSAFKKDELVQLKAGYRSDYGIIFYGKIDKVWDEKDGADVKTIVQASDLTKQLYQGGYIVKKYPKRTSVIDIVKEMFSLAGIPIGKIDDPGITLGKDMVFQGSPKQVLEDCQDLVNGEIMKKCPVKLKDIAEAAIGNRAKLALERQSYAIMNCYKHYIRQYGMAYFVKGNVKDPTAIVLDSESGLMEVQDISEEGKTSAYKVRCLLNWKIRQNAIVQINSLNVSGTFKVTKFKHVCRREDYYTEAEVSL